MAPKNPKSQLQYKDLRTNEIRDRTQQLPVSTVMRKTEMAWTLLRIENEKLPKRIYNYKPAGKRRPG